MPPDYHLGEEALYRRLSFVEPRLILVMGSPMQCHLKFLWVINYLVLTLVSSYLGLRYH
jgi:hypothetical protein